MFPLERKGGTEGGGSGDGVCAGEGQRAPGKCYRRRRAGMQRFQLPRVWCELRGGHRERRPCCGLSWQRGEREPRRRRAASVQRVGAGLLCPGLQVVCRTSTQPTWQ